MGGFIRNVLLLAIVFGIVGLVLGWLIFGRWPITDELISIQHLISPPENFVGNLLSGTQQYEEIRRNILLSGGGGVVLGIILGAIVSRR